MHPLLQQAAHEELADEVKGSAIMADARTEQARGIDAAARFLDHRGYEVIERGWDCAAGTADLIAKDDGTLVFFEVQVRDMPQGFPSGIIPREKRARFERIALSYLSQSEISNVGIRFDVLGLIPLSPGRAMVRHHINALGIA